MYVSDVTVIFFLVCWGLQSRVVSFGSHRHRRPCRSTSLDASVVESIRDLHYWRASKRLMQPNEAFVSHRTRFESILHTRARIELRKSRLRSESIRRTV